MSSFECERCHKTFSFKWYEWLSWHALCPECYDELGEWIKKGKTMLPPVIEGQNYCEDHDAYFDVNTGEWLEKTCGDKKCMFCAKRPPKHVVHKWQGHSGEWFVCGKK